MKEKDNPIEDSEFDFQDRTKDNPAISSDPIIQTDIHEHANFVHKDPLSLEELMVEELQKSYQEYNNISNCLEHLTNFEKNINKVDVNKLLTRKIFEYLKAINKDNNFKMYLTLGHIYSKILNSDKIYGNFSNIEEIKKNVGLVIDIINECIKVLEHLKNFPITTEFYDLKKKILDLSKYIYINYKITLEDDDQLDSISQLLTDFPKNFNSESYNEMLKYRKKLSNNFELLDSIETISDLFFSLNSYNEQIDIIELLFNNVGAPIPQTSQNYFSVSANNINDYINIDTDKSENINLNIYKSNEFKEYNTKGEKTDEENRNLISYGEFLLKLCSYHKIKLINKDKTQEGDTNEKKNKSGENQDQDKDNEKEENDEEIDSMNDKFVLVLIDAVKNVGGRIQKNSNENIDIQKLLKNKRCISLYDKKNLYEIIEKNFDNFKELTKNNYNQKILTIKYYLSDFLKLIKEDSYVPFNTANLDSLDLSDNFCLSKFKVKDGESEYYYIETPEKSKCLFIIEFYLSDLTKDIIFRINKYDDKINNFKIVYDAGKINKKCKVFLYCEEYSIYQLEFNNEYSWINEKEVNFNITSVKIEENVDLGNDETNVIINYSRNIFENNYISKKLMDNEKIIKYYCHLNDENFTFNCNKIYKKIYNLKNVNLNDNASVKNDNDVIITVLLYSNNLWIITVDNENNIIYKKEINNKEKIISKYFFNKIISKYLNDLTKNNPDLNLKSSKIIINIFSLNSYLAAKIPELNEILTALKVNTINNDDQSQSAIYGRYIESISFYPDSKIYGNFVSYNLYSLTEQCIIYHLFLCHCNEITVESSTLLLLFDSENIYVSAFSEGTIFTKFKGLENNWDDKYYSKLKKGDYENIIHLIESINDSFDGLDLALCYMNNSNDNERKDEKECFEMFDKIKQHCIEKIDPPLNVYLYKESELISEVVNYIGLFYED